MKIRQKTYSHPQIHLTKLILIAFFLVILLLSPSFSQQTKSTRMKCYTELNKSFSKAFPSDNTIGDKAQLINNHQVTTIRTSFDNNCQDIADTNDGWKIALSKIENTIKLLEISSKLIPPKTTQVDDATLEYLKSLSLLNNQLILNNFKQQLEDLKKYSNNDNNISRILTIIILSIVAIIAILLYVSWLKIKKNKSKSDQLSDSGVEKSNLDENKKKVKPELTFDRKGINEFLIFISNLIEDEDNQIRAEITEIKSGLSKALETTATHLNSQIETVDKQIVEALKQLSKLTEVKNSDDLKNRRYKELKDLIDNCQTEIRSIKSEIESIKLQIQPLQNQLNPTPEEIINDRDLTEGEKFLPNEFAKNLTTLFNNVKNQPPLTHENNLKNSGYKLQILKEDPEEFSKRYRGKSDRIILTYDEQGIFWAVQETDSGWWLVPKINSPLNEFNYEKVKKFFESPEYQVNLKISDFKLIYPARLLKVEDSEGKTIFELEAKGKLELDTSDGSQP